MQPLDMGIIQNMKAHYRSILLKHIISILDANISSSIDELNKKIDMVEAIRCIADAWKLVKESTIVNCSAKGGFKLDNSDEMCDDDPLHDVIIPDGFSVTQFSALVHVDSSIPTLGELSDQDLIAEVISSRSSTENTNADDDDDDVVIEPPSNKEVLHAVDILSRFSTLEGLDNPSIGDVRRNIQSKLSEGRQKLITDYFSAK